MKNFEIDIYILSAYKEKTINNSRNAAASQVCSPVSGSPRSCNKVSPTINNQNTRSAHSLNISSKKERVDLKTQAEN